MISLYCTLPFINAQTYMTLEPYKTTSCQLDTIIDIMKEFVNEDEVVHIAAYKKESNGYVITAYTEHIHFVVYSSHLGYLERGKVTFLLEESDIKDLLEKDRTHRNKSILCQQLRKYDPNNYTYDPEHPYIVGLYCGGVDWNFIIDIDGIRMIEGVKDGQIYYDKEQFKKYGMRIREKLVYYEEKKGNKKKSYKKR